MDKLYSVHKILSNEDCCCIAEYETPEEAIARANQEVEGERYYGLSFDAGHRPSLFCVEVEFLSKPDDPDAPDAIETIYCTDAYYTPFPL